MVIIDPIVIDDLLQALKNRGYEVLGPTIRDRVIVYDHLENAADLPIGWTDRQDGGSYRLEKRADNAYFGYVVGPQSWKKFLHPPILKLWEAKRNGNGFSIESAEPESPKYAFIGVRSCELAAIAIQDRVFIKGEYVDPHYQSRRKDLFTVAVNCTEPGGTCFCTSMNTGPKADGGYDLSLTEIITKKRHFFLLDSGSKKGAEIIKELPHQAASEDDIRAAETLLANASKKMGRNLETKNIKELLYQNLEHPRWEQVAERCLNCANCTMVCPTCFCTTVEDTTDLSGETATRVRRWDSCFTMDFSYIHGGSVRTSAMSRYRQWMTHKLASWQDQFGTSGCVGCGRCITWCPVGIDITEEVKAMRKNE